MRENHVKQITETFAAVAPIADTAAALFYTKLFELDPSLRRLFRHDMTEQGRKLMAVLGMAVANARNPRALKAPLGELAERHVGYGVKLAHFETVGAALLWTLDHALGERFDATTRQAWTTLYGEIVAIMAPHFERAPLQRAA